MLKNKQQGFTLIELVMVIVILGILSATALPKFADMGSEARKSVLKSALGSVKSVMAIAHAQALIKGQTGATGSITLDGQAVALVYGYPKANATGIDVAVDISGDLSITSGVIQVTSAATPASCATTYTEATSATSPATAALVGSVNCS